MADLSQAGEPCQCVLCVLAYYTEREMRNRLRPLLFDDESDSTEDGQGRDSVVQPTKIPVDYTGSAAKVFYLTAVKQDTPLSSLSV